MGLGVGCTHTYVITTTVAGHLTKGVTDQGADQLHAKLVGSVVRIRVRRQRETTPPIRSELLLQQLRVQTARERHLHENIQL